MVFRAIGLGKAFRKIGRDVMLSGNWCSRSVGVLVPDTGREDTAI